jgi:hypothetical protein
MLALSAKFVEAKRRERAKQSETGSERVQNGQYIVPKGQSRQDDANYGID